MDEARATAAVDLVRRPHAEITLAFGGERVGTLAVSLLRHALERFAIEAGCTVHVEASGADDHHVAEAAYKALGQSFRQAVAPGGAGIRSTKGARVRVAIADYGAGNLRSLSSALIRAGADPIVTVDPAVVHESPLALIAGVGHVESAAAGLARHGLDDALRERVAAGRPVAGICVGLQLLFGESEEGGAGPRAACRIGTALDGEACPAHRLEHARRVPPFGSRRRAWTAQTSTSPTASRPSPTSRAS